MGGARGDSSATRAKILAAARELFARHGVDGVSVRRIAAKAGVDHALVHRYFGTKSEMAAEIVRAEAQTLADMGRPEADLPTSLSVLTEAFEHLLTEGRTTMLLMIRAELDGLAPENMLGEPTLRPVRQLADWLEREGSATAGEVDPRVAAMVLGAMVMGLVGMQPLLAAGAGLADEDPEDLRRRCVRAAVALAAAAVGAAPSQGA
jgi:AcrR family transcriptional regulator